MFEKPYLQVIKYRIGEPRNFIQVVMGPRQVGKTTVSSSPIPRYCSPYEQTPKYHSLRQDTVVGT